MDSINWCGYNWNCLMGGYRKMHPGYPWEWYDLDQVHILDNGTLMLTLEYKPNVITYEGITYKLDYAVPYLRSIEDFGFGIFSADIKLPKGINLWNAFWLTGNGNWPPEIDICENWTNDNGSYFRYLIPQPPYVIPNWKTTFNVHYREDDLTITSTGSRDLPILKQFRNPSNNFINYKVDWREDRITWYVNNKKIRELTGEVPAKLIKNIKDPDKGYRMNVIFDMSIEVDPKLRDFELLTPMYIRNFKYECH